MQLVAHGNQFDELLELAKKLLADGAISCEGCAHWTRLLSAKGKKVALGECEISDSYTGEGSQCPKYLKREA